MEQPLTAQIYDEIGGGYCQYRVPDRRIASQIRAAIGNASSVCNIGAGTGSYEPSDLLVIPVEPSERMIEQRRDPSNVIRAKAESLPFNEKQFDVAMAILTVHHWLDQRKGLAEMRRVSNRQVILTFDPDMADSFWLVRDYLPEFAELDRKRAFPLQSYQEVLGICTVSPVFIPWDCTDGFLAANWRRPEKYLDPNVRRAVSSFSLVSADVVSAAISRLAHDLESGAWAQRYAALFDHEQMDFGYRLVVADNSAEPCGRL